MMVGTGINHTKPGHNLAMPLTKVKLERSTLKEQAYQALLEMIQAHRFSEETHINVEQISKELGVSRTPVWQALKRLEEEGLVRHEPNRGIIMVGMTAEMAADLYLVRGVLEGQAARLAAELMSPEDIARLGEALARQRSVVQARDLKGYSQSDFQFHAIIYENCGNWMLKELLGNIKMRTRPLRRNISPILDLLYQDHQEVVQALSRSDPDGAEQAMKKHNRRMQRLMESGAPAHGGPPPQRRPDDKSGLSALARSRARAAGGPQNQSLGGDDATDFS